MRTLSMQIRLLEENPAGFEPHSRRYQGYIPASLYGRGGDLTSFVMGPRSIADLGPSFGLGEWVEVEWIETGGLEPVPGQLHTVRYDGREIWPDFSPRANRPPARKAPF